MDCRVAYPLKLIARLYRIEHLADASDLAKAAAYMINHWAALTRFLQDGRLKLDNNLCEQQLRAIALGRNNFLFFGSHRAAERAAVLYSLTRTCALQRVSRHFLILPTSCANSPRAGPRAVLTSSCRVAGSPPP
jgi:hypothetical protein